MDPIQTVKPKDSRTFIVEFNLKTGATSYTVRVEDANGFFREDTVSSSPAEIKSLTPYTEYTLSIMAVNSGGRSQPSSPVMAKTGTVVSHIVFICGQNVRFFSSAAGKLILIYEFNGKITLEGWFMSHTFTEKHWVLCSSLLHALQKSLDLPHCSSAQTLHTVLWVNAHIIFSEVWCQCWCKSRFVLPHKCIWTPQDPSCMGGNSTGRFYVKHNELTWSREQSCHPSPSLPSQEGGIWST